MLLAGSGQLRTMGGLIVGLDLGAVLALGAAMGACMATLAEMAAAIEPIAVQKINERLRS